LSHFFRGRVGPNVDETAGTVQGFTQHGGAANAVGNPRCMAPGFAGKTNFKPWMMNSRR
jgi:hypothetical protein